MFVIRVLLRVAIAVTLFGALLFGSAGRFDIPAFWIWLAVFLVAMPAMMLAAGSDLVRERIKPGPGGKDYLVRMLAIPAMIANLVIAGLDVGRFHWSDTVPAPVQIAAFIAMAACMGIWGIAMHQNRFFSSVVRIQTDRGHHVIDTGLYGIVRHPGYAAGLLSQFASPIALGSWLAMIPNMIMLLLLLRRTMMEDRTLKAELPGYSEYASRVRYRLVPGLW